MFNAFERKLAWRYLRSRKGERFASVIAAFSLGGIALGVATLIIVMAVMNGFKADLMGRILGLHGDLGVYGYGRPIDHYAPLAERVRHAPGVTMAVPLLQGTVLMQAGSFSTGAMVEGVAPADLLGWKALSNGLVEGTWHDWASAPASVAIGVTMASHAGLNVGSEVTLLSPNGRPTAFGTMPRVMRAHVTAIFDANWNDYNSNIILMPLPQAQRFLLAGDAVSVIQVSTANPMEVRPVGRAVAHVLDDRPLQVLDWTQSANGFLEAVTVEQNVMFLILALIILVAAFNVISSLIMMVRDKAADIAILRTFGASRGAVMRVFMMCGLSVGVAGTMVGTALGVGFALNIERIKRALEAVTGVSLFNPQVYFLAHLPARLIWSQVFGVVGLSLALSFLATLYPSWRAARTDPVKTLRHE
ncbi:lipoprotein-releasing ABC transporter permease subunit [Formicincola oecophyllae]|uniref:Lipoprotein-releasing ABC transporter permease subunit n=1 Tax=Formicincola oecophyllae TaxID=2558361 RepID=A0A4Y6U6H9_9PROT|nr:lipoprotein-releasing ABC transporter permease subunit [Formicincola oecophyllae]QDH12959.1 lipoprotein-releasing ABC transporter permease subunit [Formicincola oecophyllae]